MPARPPPARLAPSLQVPDVTGILDRLLLFLAYDKDYVTSETLVQVGGRHCGVGGVDRFMCVCVGGAAMCVWRKSYVTSEGWGGGLLRVSLPLPSCCPHFPLHPALPHPPVQMTDVLRRYPDAAEACVESIAAIPQESVAEPAARAAYLWVLGEYGTRIQVRRRSGRSALHAVAQKTTAGLVAAGMLMYEWASFSPAHTPSHNPAPHRILGCAAGCAVRAGGLLRRVPSGGAARQAGARRGAAPSLRSRSRRWAGALVAGGGCTRSAPPPPPFPLPPACRRC